MLGAALPTRVRDNVAAADGPDAVVAGKMYKVVLCPGRCGGRPAATAGRVCVTLARAFAAYEPESAELAVTLFSGHEGATRQQAAWRTLTGGPRHPVAI